MAIYRHYEDKEELLRAVADEAFEVLGGYLRPVLRQRTPLTKALGVLERYLDFALEQPRLFEIAFLTRRPGTRRFPEDFAAGKSPSFDALCHQVRACMKEGVLRTDDPLEVTLALWAHAHGLVLLHLAGRFDTDDARFRKIYRRSIERLIRGLATAGL
jgi:AcrR family transcriptional regulator